MQVISDDIRSKIVSGDWPVGSRLPAEARLAETLGVSRSTLREALRNLGSQGLLEARHGDGTFVQATNVSDLAWEQVLDGCAMAELIIGCRAVEREAIFMSMTGSGHHGLIRARPPAPAKSAPLDKSQLLADFAFHGALVQAAGSTLLSELHRHFWRSIRAELVHDEPGAVPACWLNPSLHLELIRVLQNGDAATTAGALDKMLVLRPVSRRGHTSAH